MFFNIHNVCLCVFIPGINQISDKFQTEFAVTFSQIPLNLKDGLHRIPKLIGNFLSARLTFKKLYHLLNQFFHFSNICFNFRHSNRQILISKFITYFNRII
ncbi:hypothetical protein Hdeb2414_s0006g00200761 [Helianthus debilis subsp. tardiflorus]